MLLLSSLVLSGDLYVCLSAEVAERERVKAGRISVCLLTGVRAEHEKLLTYIPPASVGRVECGGGACETA